MHRPYPILSLCFPPAADAAAEQGRKQKTAPQETLNI